MSDQASDRQRFEELLSFYVNHRLGEEDHLWMVDYLAKHPEAVSLVQVEQRLRAIVGSTASPVPESIRLHKLLREYRSLKSRPSLFGRVSQWFAQAYRIPAPAIAAVMALFLVQSIALVQLVPDQQGETERYRGTKVPCDDTPQIRIVFKPDAQQAEVVMLLRKVEAGVVAGPTETGQLWVKIPKGRPIDEALGQLKASVLVDEAILTEAHTRGCLR